MNIETALKLAKPYVGSLAKDPGSRPVLKTALVTEEYVIATNTHILIRIKHDDIISEPYLHKYRDYKELEYDDVSRYPKGVHKLVPTPDSRYTSGTLDTKEMVEAIEGACVTSTQNTKALGLPNPQHVLMEPAKMSVTPTVLNFETGSYTYIFSNKLPLENTAFNPHYLKMAFKTFKAAGEKSINSHWVTPDRPWLLTSNDIEVVVLPVRILRGKLN